MIYDKSYLRNRSLLQRKRKYLKTKEGSLEEAISQAINEKKLDPVGKEDGDIDNDGDIDILITNRT